MSTEDKVLEYQFEGEADAGKRLGFEYLCFKVPEGSCTIEVEYEYKGKGPGEATVDIGLFQPGDTGLIEGMRNLRGWSGSNKKAFKVSRDWATPSYLPGEIIPGEWKVILGFYKVPDQGLIYKVRIRVSPQCVSVSQPRMKRVERKGFKGWVKGDLHVHSVHSDGDSTIDQISEVASSLGLDFVAVTDHNVVSHIAELGWTSRFVGKTFFIRGVELTSYKGHMNVYGISEVPEFRLTSRDELERVVKYLRGKNAFLSVNHPKPLGPDWELGDISFADSIEVFHSVWEFNNYVSLRKWDELLENGYRIGIVGGSDAHEIRGKASLLLPGTPTTWIYVEEMSEHGIIEGLRAQRVFISESPEGPRILLGASLNGQTFGMGDVVNSRELKLNASVEGARGHYFRIISGGEVVASERVEDDIYNRSFDLKLNSAYVRAEVLKEAEAIDEPFHMENILSALTAPIYIKL